MKLHYTLYLVKLLLVNVYPAVTQTLRHASFSIIPNSIYIPQFSSNFIINLTSNTISNTSKCAEKCLSYTLCQTATFYARQQTCSLYNENSNAGQVATAINQSTTVVAMISREPKSKHFSPVIFESNKKIDGIFHLLNNSCSSYSLMYFL